jgi:hypothetical protein
MNTSSPSKPVEAAAAPGDLYSQALVREGFQPSEELVLRVRQMHLATLTSGLVMRAFSMHRQAKLRAAQQDNKSTTAAPSRS